MNQPKSALSGKMQIDGPTPEVKVLAATEEPLEAMMRRIIAEYRNKPAEPKRPNSQPTKIKRPFPRPEQEAFKRSRQEAQTIHPPYQNRQHND
jgi:hypothetical protein